MSGSAPGGESERKKTLRVVFQETVQPFLDLIKAPRALWGVNLAYVLEGLVYFGILNYLTIHFSSFVFRGVENPDIHSHSNVMILTAGITIAMFFLGFVADRRGVRFALILAFALLLSGRVLISAAPTVLGLPPGLWSGMHLATLGGILLVVVGYGMYQPAAYAAVRQFTTPKTAAMGFAMLYALMNLGGYLNSFAWLLRDESRGLGLGIPGTFWVYTGFTLLALLATLFILSPRVVRTAIARAKEETARIKAEGKEGAGSGGPPAGKPGEQPGPAAGLPARVPRHMWGVWAALVFVAWWLSRSLAGPAQLVAPALVFLAPAGIRFLLQEGQRGAVVRWIARHPLADGKFFFFIFALIPVQTLFTYNWLILPQYLTRAFTGTISEQFELFNNMNPLLVFLFVPIITAFTQKAPVYRMMILGTLVMALPAFFLVIGPYPVPLILYLVVMTIGESMWQPRFLQYAAQIAPEGRTGVYIGVAQLPWFLTKFLVPLLYSGWMMQTYCPEAGAKDTQTMWLIFGCIAMASPVLLFLARGWAGKGIPEPAK